VSAPATGRCLVMGILNRTPDSFYDGGRTGLAASVEHARRMVDHGADIVDVGGVKAGPGVDVTEQEELQRVVPLVQTIKTSSEVAISVETSRPRVARAALDAGATIVNDVSALAEPELASVCAAGGARLVVMHHGGQVRGRPRNPRYGDVVADVRAEWERLVGIAAERGLPRDRLIADPGLDFGKTTFHSLELMRRLSELTGGDLPVLVAASRKDVVGETLDLPPAERLEGSLALVALAVLQDASFVRVHDVKETTRTVAMVEAVMGRRPPLAPIRGLWE
jgi:dihydropteroate synthase